MISTPITSISIKMFFPMILVTTTTTSPTPNPTTAVTITVVVAHKSIAEISKAVGIVIAVKVRRWREEDTVPSLGEVFSPWIGLVVCMVKNRLG